MRAGPGGVPRSESGWFVRNLLDANVVLRYLLRDDEAAAADAKRLVDEGAFLLTEVLCEVVYVMEDCYAIPRAEICGFLTDFINEVICPDGDVLKTALSVYRARKKLDLVDCILAARHQVSGDRVFTFDRKLNNAIKSIDETGSAIPTGAFLV